jgi:hypothetical protein
LVHVVELCEATTCACGSVDGNEAVPGPVAILLVAGSTVCVVEAFKDLGAKDVITVCDEVSGFGVEGGLIGRWLRVVGVVGGVVYDPAEGLGANFCGGAVVGVFTAVDEGEAEVDVFLLLED